VHQLLDYLNEHRPLVYSIAASLLLGLLGLIGGIIFVVRMRPDALTKKPAKRKSGKRAAAIRIGRNILGWLLILAGIAMLVLPGPGLVVMLVGITLADFPGKRPLQLWILSRRHILGPINRLRKRFGREPLKVNGKTEKQK